MPTLHTINRAQLKSLRRQLRQRRRLITTAYTLLYELHQAGYMTPAFYALRAAADEAILTEGD